MVRPQRLTRYGATFGASLRGRFQVVPALNAATRGSSMVADALPVHEMQSDQSRNSDRGRPCADDDLIGRKYNPVRAKPYQTRHQRPKDEHHHAQPRHLADDIRGVWRFPCGRSLPPQFHMFLILGHHLHFNESTSLPLRLCTSKN